MQRRVFSAVGVLLLGVMTSCSRALPFATYQQEVFAPTAITASTQQTIRLANPQSDQPQHVRAIAFDAGGNPGGHFQIQGALVGGKSIPAHDLIIPPGGAIELLVDYAPRNLTTTRADFGGWATGQPERYIPQAAPPPVDAPAAPSATSLAATLVGARHADVTPASSPLATPQATHRALIIMVYDFPSEGVVQIELVGQATPGPHGETTATGGGGEPAPSECAPSATRACFTGDFSITIPGLMDAPKTTTLSGPLTIAIDGSTATISMAQFPTALFVLEGVPGIPVDAVSIAISGDDRATATGTFDGTALTLSGLSVRARFFLSRVALDDLAGTNATADFFIPSLTLTTLEPLTDGVISLGITTTLSANPAGNGLVDPYLGGKKIIVTMKGTLLGPITK